MAAETKWRTKDQIAKTIDRMSLLQNSPLKRVGKTNYRKTLRFLIWAYLAIPEIPEFCKRLNPEKSF